MAPAYCLWALARLQLGTSFAIRPQAKELVARGLYAKIQNAVYVFNAIFYAGFFILFGKPAWFLFFLVMIPLQYAHPGGAQSARSKIRRCLSRISKAHLVLKNPNALGVPRNLSEPV